MVSVTGISGVTMMEGEEVLHDIRPSWANWSKQLILFLIITIVTAGLGIVLFILPWRSRRKTRYIVTTQRVIHKKSSLFSTKTMEYPIRDIAQLQTGSGRLSFGTGHVQFSAGGGGEIVELAGLSNHKTIANAIREQQRQLAE